MSHQHAEALAEALAEDLNAAERVQVLPAAVGIKQVPPKPCQVYMGGQWWRPVY